MNNLCPLHHRRAISLIELLVVMSAASVILSLSAGLIHRVMHAETKTRSVSAIERTSLRLANVFRCDVHNARQARAEPSGLPQGVFVQLETSPGERVEYRREEQTIHRISLDGDQIIARELFVFPTEFEIVVQIEPAPLVVLTVTSPDKKRHSDNQDSVRLAQSPPIQLQVTAALNRGDQ